MGIISTIHLWTVFILVMSTTRNGGPPSMNALINIIIDPWAKLSLHASFLNRGGYVRKIIKLFILLWTLECENVDYPTLNKLT